MRRLETTRGDLARALAERSRATGKQITEGQAQDELDRIFHSIVTGLRRGRPVEMPGIGTMKAFVQPGEKAGEREAASGQQAGTRKTASPRKSRS